MSEDKENEKCDYDTGPCKGMKMVYMGNCERGNGLFALDNLMNFKTGDFFHGGFYVRTPGTGKNGLMLNFCPFCGSDLMKNWHKKYKAASAASRQKFEKENPEYEDDYKEAKADFEQRLRAYMEGLDKDVRESISKLSTKQREGLLEAWDSSGKFWHGTMVRQNTIDSICRVSRGLTEHPFQSKLSLFGMKVRKALEDMPSGFMLPLGKKKSKKSGEQNVSG